MGMLLFLCTRLSRPFVKVDIVQMWVLLFFLSENKAKKAETYQFRKQIYKQIFNIVV